MSNITLIKILTEADKARLRLVDRRPTLALYRIAHVGVSGGAVVGIGNLPKRWTSARVMELAAAMNTGDVPVYRGHRTGSSMRRPVGRVIKCFTGESAGSVEAMALVHITDKFSAEDALMKKLDAASIEADLSLEPTATGWDVAQVEKVTGLALAEKKLHATGFPRAGLIAAVQETLDSPDTPPTPDNSESGDIHHNIFADVDNVIGQILNGKNLTKGERDYVHRKASSVIPPDADSVQIKREVETRLQDLDEVKRLYRRPPPESAAPAERRRGPLDYSNPEHNELIPR